MTFRALRPYIIAVGMTLPGVSIRFLHPDVSPLLVAALSGMAILGASFLLTWACEVAQMDIPQAVAVAVVAFIAVLPEYAVDMYFTWMAGQHPESAYSHYAIANMTGANRLLIGVGWSAIVLIFAGRFHSAVALHSRINDADARVDGEPREPGFLGERVSLRLRAWPVIQMLEQAHAADKPSVWAV